MDGLNEIIGNWQNHPFYLIFLFLSDDYLLFLKIFLLKKNYTFISGMLHHEVYPLKGIICGNG